MDQYMVTTVDNPHSPFDDWDSWYEFDERHGYCTSGLLARLIQNSDALSEEDQVVEFNRVVDEIVEINSTGLYKKVVKTESV